MSDSKTTVPPIPNAAEDAAKKAQEVAAKAMAPLPSEEALVKAMEGLEAAARRTPEGRREELLAKSQAKTASPEETTELVGLLSGTGGGGLGEALNRAMTPAGDSTMAKSMTATNDVGKFLSEWHGSIQSGLALVGDAFQKSDTRNLEIAHVLAKAVMDQSVVVLDAMKLVKAQGVEIAAMKDQLAKAMTMPGSQPRAATNVTQMFEKATFGGGAAPGMGDGQSTGYIPKGEVLETMWRMVQSGYKGMSGEDVGIAMTAYEPHGGSLSKAMAEDVKSFRKQERQVAQGQTH